MVIEIDGTQYEARPVTQADIKTAVAARNAALQAQGRAAMATSSPSARQQRLELYYAATNAAIAASTRVEAGDHQAVEDLVDPATLLAAAGVEVRDPAHVQPMISALIAQAIEEYTHGQ